MVLRFRHVVMMRWKSPLDAGQVGRVKQMLDDLGAQAPSVRAITHGPDLAVRQGGYDYVLVADFDDADGWRAYSHHPAHDVLRSEMPALVENQHIVQYAVEVPGDDV